jgi:hypothetical protein
MLRAQNPLLQNNGRPPPQGIKRGADAMMCVFPMTCAV